MSKIDNQSINEVLTDSLTKYRNKLGQEVAFRKIIVAQKNKAQLKYLKTLQSQDSVVKRLQKKLSKRTSTLVGVDIVTKYDTVLKTIVQLDSNNYPVYSFSVKDEWVNMFVKCTKDSSEVDLSMVNKVDIEVKHERLKWYKKKEMNIEVTQLNPYTGTDNVQGFTFQNKKKYNGLKLLGMLLIGGLFIR